MAVVLALIAATSFATTAVFARIGAQGINPRAGTWISLIPGLAVAAIPALILDLAEFADVLWVGLLWVLLVAFLFYPMGNLTSFVSVAKIGASRAVPLFASAPVFAAILAVVLLDERPNAPIILGTVAVMAGVVLIFSERWGGAKGKGSDARSTIIGYAAGLVAGAAYGAGDYTAKVAVSDFATPLVTATIALVMGIIMLSPLAGPDILRIRGMERRSISMFALAGTTASIGSVTLLLALDRGDVVVVSPLVSVSPLITLALARVFLRQLEALTLPVISGAAIVVAGVVLVAVGDVV